ncbi:halocyanin-like protein [Haloarcula quadrata]|uniref:Halocyanin-like protein n=1 Tax=Haloarcula quadrata TaxID=182779 RepID=A0A495QQL9_9EURY|nr:halocyanin domain-containing protein [Haloarcula quadrata]RKS75142.1 halocyanin-like protein [Haloarcula quadrata]
MKSNNVQRRRLLQATVSIFLSGTILSTVTESTTAQTDFGGWLSDTSNYDGTVVERTGQNEVIITVGAEGNGGSFAFDPPAVAVSSGTTVIWEWTGKGGGHTIAEENGRFESQSSSNEGYIFEHTFESGGIVRYLCKPHSPLGMRGVIDVRDADGETSSPSSRNTEQADSPTPEPTDASLTTQTETSPPTPNSSQSFGSVLTALLAGIFSTEALVVVGISIIVVLIVQTWPEDE